MSGKLVKHSPRDYIFKEELGHGSYSTVYKAIDKNNVNKFYAIKVCSKNHIIKENKVKYVTIEKNVLNILRKGNHPGVIKLFYTFHDAENLYFVLSYAINGELLQLLHKMRTFSEDWSIHFCSQIIDIIEFIHKNGIIHRDLKPENILLDKNNNLILTDFGAASIINKPSTPTSIGNSNDNCPSETLSCSSFVGTAEYVSPELLLYNKCSYGSDIWAIGCIAFQFFQGYPPFRGSNELKTFEKIVALDYRWSDPHHLVSQNAKDLVNRILTIDPNKRLSLNEIKKHIWFQSVDWNAKEKMWTGIWSAENQVHNTNNVMKNTTSNNNIMNDRQLHVIDTPIRNIPITKQKKKGKPIKVSNTTSSIVEWRKKLGISSLNISNNNNTNSPVSAGSLESADIQNYATTVSSKPMNLGTTNINVDSQLPGSTISNSQFHNNTNISNINPKNKIKVEQNIGNNIVKQEFVYIHEIAYDSSGPDMSLLSYKKINNDLITVLVSTHRSELRSPTDLIPNLLTLYKDGSLIYSTNGPKNNSIRQTKMVNIGDKNLSMYDFEFDELTKKGFLILEKYRFKMWFISLPLLASFPYSSLSSYPVIKKYENWVDCLFKSRQLLEDQQLMTNMMMGTSIDNSMDGITIKKAINPEISLSKNIQMPSPPNTAPPNIPIVTKPTDSTSTSNMDMNLKKIPTNSSSKRNSSNSPTINSSSSFPNTITRSITPKQPVKKYSAPSNLVISSSRYEVLHTLRKTGPIDPSYYKNKENESRPQERELENYGTAIASSGASAAFKNQNRNR